MKRITALCLAAFLALAGTALGQRTSLAEGAGLDVVGPVPAATLLIPYFEVDVSDTACSTGLGRTTLISVNNAGPAPTLAHVELWTDQAIPALGFTIYLTGYDVQTMSLHDLFCLGDLPRTGFAVSHRGALSAPNIAFELCNNTPNSGIDPVWGPASIATLTRNHLKAWFTGKQSPLTGNCAAADRGRANTLAIGYVTIDQVKQCNSLLPSDPGYFGSGIPGFDNVLWGDFFLVDVGGTLSQGFSAVAIQAADPQDVDTAYMPGEHTFYGRYLAAAAMDQREPLPTTTAARFASGAGFDRAVFYVWRETGERDTSYPCALPGPAWYPLGADNTSGAGPILVFDENENVLSLPPDDAPPNAVNRITVGPGSSTDYTTGSINFGWIYQNLQHDAVMPIYGDVAAQQYTVWAISAEGGRYSVGLDAFQLDTANDPIVENP